MLTLLKRNPEHATDENRAWHSNFRNAAELPDTKVVRTAFFINSVAVLLFASVLLLFVYQEYTIAGLRGEIATAEQQLEKEKKPSAQAIALYKTFGEEDKKIIELETFLKGNKIVLSEFITRVGQLLPKRMSITTVEYSEAGVIVRGHVGGTAAEIASNYEKAVKEDAAIKQQFESVSITNLSRDPEGARFSFELTFKFPSQKKELKKP